LELWVATSTPKKLPIFWKNNFLVELIHIYLTPKVLRGQILAFAGFGHVAMIRRYDIIF
jgi:hypothetical protein